MESSILIYLIVYGVASGVTCGYVASEKNRSTGGWFLLGLLFGVFAMFAIAGVPKRDPIDWQQTSSSKETRPVEVSNAIRQVPELTEEQNSAALQDLIDRATKDK